MASGAPAVCAGETAADSFIKVQDARKDQCIRDLRRALLFFKMNAKTCGLDDEQIASLPGANALPSDPRCGQPLGVHRNDTQQMAFEDCYRVYVCATRASNCSIKRIEAGMNCELAVQQCMGEHPIPK
ncbi:MAG: hypothetical protein IT510_10370 [Sulfuritalea sp.]|nr:hypothetical protein [Sulfuritalea sp.]